MPHITIVPDENKVVTNSTWEPAKKFNCHGKIVDSKGNTISAGYQGRRYLIIAKREREIGIIEFFIRFLVGFALACLVLPLISKSVRQLTFQTKVTIWYAKEILPQGRKLK